MIDCYVQACFMRLRLLKIMVVLFIKTKTQSKMMNSTIMTPTG